MSRLIRKVRSLGLRRILVIVGVVVVLVTAEEILRDHRYHFYPRHFRTVEPGAIYRGGRQTPRILRKILADHDISTIVNLDDKILNGPGTDRYAAEKTIAKQAGVQYRGFIWKGGGIGPFEEYDAVADILASTASQPVFVHCAAGEKRSNAALAAYWMRHCGYTYEQAVEHLQRDYGLIPARKRDFMRHLQAYYEYTQRNPRTRDVPPGRIEPPLRKETPR